MMRSVIVIINKRIYELLVGRTPTIPKMAAHACVTVDHVMSMSRIMSVQFIWRTVNVH